MTTLPRIIKTQKMQRAELTYEQIFSESKDIRDILRDWLKEKRSIYYIAFALNVSDETIRNWSNVFRLNNE